MKIREKIEKKGYKIISLSGYYNGSQSVTGYMAVKGNYKIKAKSLTQLYKNLI